ncbi:hypothetical protein BS47DRAFT_256749 [Hydnum rufescens UP504]|uniref:Uncharacterized protein n=1 Tax=Hydnum rufescens UP504 TaxID=1448309 RepID=A0A9P6DR28_9AGAM|nr:hypothetical protein BS47DRAFT_256749 [Hydnum rufescens UP504]
MIYSLVFVAVALGPGIGASPLMATPPMMARDLSFGTCTNPCVSFSSGAFVPENLGDFPHKSVGDPGVIFPFICSQLVNKCGLHKTDPAVLACLNVAPRAEALGAKGIAADTFNAALGFTTHFATVDKSGRNTRSLAGSARDEPAHAPQDGVKGAAPPPKDHDGRPPPSRLLRSLRLHPPTSQVPPRLRACCCAMQVLAQILINMKDRKDRMVGKAVPLQPRAGHLHPHLLRSLRLSRLHLPTSQVPPRLQACCSVR